MSDLFGNHIVGFPTRRLKCLKYTYITIYEFDSSLTLIPPMTFAVTYEFYKAECYQRMLLFFSSLSRGTDL